MLTVSAKEDTKVITQADEQAHPAALLHEERMRR